MLKKLLVVIVSIAGLIAVSISSLIFGQMGKVAGDFFSRPSQQEVETVIIESFTTTANQINQKLPMMVDQDTRVDKVTVGPGPRIIYHHTFRSLSIKMSLLLHHCKGSFSLLPHSALLVC